METGVISHERALRDYYDEEARRAVRQDKGPLRVELQQRFATLLSSESRRSVVDIGAGPGLDTAVFAAAGFAAVGIDLAPENIRIMSSNGIPGVAGSLFQLPLRPESFDSVWTMSTLVHVPDARFGEALSSLVAVAVPGAPIGIGTWGGFDWEGISDRDDIVPPRFFALRTTERLRRMLAEHGDVESLETFRPNRDTNWDYQFAVIRV